MLRPGGEKDKVRMIGILIAEKTYDDKSEYDNVGDEGATTLPKVISGTPTVLGSSYQ